MRDVVICSAVRTAIGSFNGALASVSAVELGSVVMQSAIERAGLRPQQMDEVIFGNVLQGGLGQNPARQAAVKAGIPVEVEAYTVNKVCGSGLKTVNLAAQAIMSGSVDVVLAGGMESMTQAPYLLEKARWGQRMGHAQMTDTMIQDGLWCAFNDYHMGITAENIAEKYGITREEQDALAVASQEKACRAIESGAFRQEIVPVTVKRKKEESVVDTDEYPKKGTSMQTLGRLRPAFKKEGSVTAGNASGINDGAAALVVMAAEKARELGLKPLARIVSFASAGVEPAFMGMGPVAATRKALANAGLALRDIDLVEANEAFAAQFLAVGKELGFDRERVNINGGAIALGHPIGASGARILVTLLHVLAANQLKTGLATLCIGGGQGIATVVERI